MKPDFGEATSNPSTLKSELEKVVGRMKWRQAEGTGGSDGVVVEVVETTGELAITGIVGGDG